MNYQYDTRAEFNYTEKKFPWDGWFFPCFHCGGITSNVINSVYKTYKQLRIPYCKKCQYQVDLDISKITLSKSNIKLYSVE